MGLSIDAGLDNGTRIRRVVRIDVQHHISASLCHDGANIRDSLFAIAFCYQGDVFTANRFSKVGSTLVPGRVIRIGQRSDGIDERRLAIGSKCLTRYRTQHRSCTGQRRSAADKCPAWDTQVLRVVFWIHSGDLSDPGPIEWLLTHVSDGGTKPRLCSKNEKSTRK